MKSDFDKSISPHCKCIVRCSLSTSLFISPHLKLLEEISDWIGLGNLDPMYFPIIFPFHLAAIISPFSVLTNPNSFALFWNILICLLISLPFYISFSSFSSTLCLLFSKSFISELKTKFSFLWKHVTFTYPSLLQ